MWKRIFARVNTENNKDIAVHSCKLIWTFTFQLRRMIYFHGREVTLSKVCLSPFWKRSTLKGKNLLTEWADSFLWSRRFLERKANMKIKVRSSLYKNGGQIPNLPIHLKRSAYIYIMRWGLPRPDGQCEQASPRFWKIFRHKVTWYLQTKSIVLIHQLYLTPVMLFMNCFTDFLAGDTRFHTPSTCLKIIETNLKDVCYGPVNPLESSRAR